MRFSALQELGSAEPGTLKVGSPSQTSAPVASMQGRLGRTPTLGRSEEGRRSSMDSREVQVKSMQTVLVGARFPTDSRKMQVKPMPGRLQAAGASLTMGRRSPHIVSCSACGLCVCILFTTSRREAANWWMMRANVARRGPCSASVCRPMRMNFVWTVRQRRASKRCISCLHQPRKMCGARWRPQRR